MISLQDISFEFGGRYLYQDASWHIKPRERIGLIGQNGTGKSTLLRIINGEFGISGGVIGKQGGLQIGFLNQDLLSQQVDMPIVEVAMEAFDRQLKLEKEIDKTIHLLETAYHEDLVHTLGDLQHEFELLDGYNIRYKTEAVLEGLGFVTDDLTKMLTTFSGGWRMRVMLARMLLAQPEVLMLDEPTNHLDLPSIQWLEEYLKDYPGTVIVVSHDRFFLNKLCTKIVEIYGRKFYTYEGNYDFFMKEKVERTELQQRQFENQQQYIKEQEKFINRFRAKASKSTAVQSRVKMLDKLDVIDAPEDLTAEVNIRFHFSTPSSKVVAEFENLGKSYGTKEIFRSISGEIAKGDKIAVIGANGLGKSTLLKIIASHVDFTGKMQIGYNVHYSFYAQHQLESLNVNSTILEELMHHSATLKEGEARAILGCFLFSGDDVFKKIRVLSGGEKSRVALAKTIVSDSNFLLLDEPTNHLDMQSVSVLTEALNDYNGTLLMVSHDREFISNTANKIWWIENHELKEYPGTYTEFVEWNAKRKATNQPKNLSKENSITEKKVDSPLSTGNGQSEVKKNKQLKKTETMPTGQAGKKNNAFEIKQLQKQLDEIGTKIDKLKSDKQKMEQDFMNSEIFEDGTKYKALQQRYATTEEEFKTVSSKYDTLFEKLIELEA